MPRKDEISELIAKKQIKTLLNRIDRIPESAHVPPITEWAEEKRFLPVGSSEVPGYFRRETVPHMVEILERMHPDDPCTHVVLMKSVQAAATTTIAENALGFFIDYKLGSILFLTSSKGIGNVRSSSTIDTMIDNAGLIIKPISERRKRKTGDMALYKEFAGNIKLLISSYNSIADLKSNTFHLIICDEWDEAKEELKNQGDVEGIIEGRTMGLHGGYKILQLSTPSNASTSRINKSYLEGDQREYYVPCPHCGEMQVLRLKSFDRDYGLTFTTRTDEDTHKKILIPETVRYICKHCHKEFQESKKLDMLAHGEWRATAPQKDPFKYSYHISGLISPFLEWRRICQEFINCDFGTDVLKFKNFVINYLGEPWASPHEIMPWEEFRDRAENYHYPEAPEGVIEYNQEFGLTEYRNAPIAFFGGVDVQGDRLELQVVGFNAGMESWSVDYQIFYGKPMNADDPCWTALSEYVYSKTYKVGGIDILIDLVAIDAGWDPRDKKESSSQVHGLKASLVYDFVAARQDLFIAVMGVHEDKQPELLKEARINNGGVLKKRYNVSSGQFKHAIMSNVYLPSGAHAIHFPRYQMLSTGAVVLLNNSHFKQFLSERYQEDSKGNPNWTKINARNEVLDTWIYARAAAEFHGYSSKSRYDWAMLFEAYQSANKA